VQLIEVHSDLSFKKYFAKIDLLSHSHSNKNMYNNFIVEYWFDNGYDKIKCKFAKNSEIAWPIK
jgi:hypothetical protein